MPKVTVCIDKDEWYPVFILDDQKKYGTKIEVEQETLDRWTSAFIEFEAIQEQMFGLLEAEEKKPQPATK